MEPPPPYDTPIASPIDGSIIHHFILKQYFDASGMKYYSNVLLKKDNGHEQE